MRHQAARLTLALIAAATLATAGCSLGSGDGKSNASARPTVKDTGGQGGVAATVNMPVLAGKDLKAATDQVKAAGFADVAFHDAAGQGRTPIPDATWKVCDQAPAPGPSNPQERVDIGAVPSKDNCSGQPTASPPPQTTAAPTTRSAPPTSAPPTPTQAPPSRPATSRPPQYPTGWPTEFVFYRNCAEAKAAGAAPLYRGQPGYSRLLDKDGDGVACER